MSMYDNVTAADMLAVALPEEPEPESNLGDELYNLAGSLWPHYAESGDAVDLLYDVPVIGRIGDMMKYGGTDREDALGNIVGLATDIPGLDLAAMATLPIRHELIKAIKEGAWGEAKRLLSKVVTSKRAKPLSDEAYFAKGLAENDAIADRTMRKYGIVPKDAHSAIDAEDMGLILNTVAHTEPQGKRMAQIVSKDLLDAISDPTYAIRFEANRQRRNARKEVVDILQQIKQYEPFTIAHPDAGDIDYATRLYAQAKQTGQPELVEKMSEALNELRKRYLQGQRK